MNDYYPFGMAMPERSFDSPKYRYGFNGKEKDESGEWGDLTHYDYGFRIYNPGIGRFLSRDPLTSEYPFYSPYQYAGNKPIRFVDLDGLETYDPLKDPFFTAKLFYESAISIGDGAYNTLGIVMMKGANTVGGLSYYDIHKSEIASSFGYDIEVIDLKSVGLRRVEGKITIVPDLPWTQDFLNAGIDVLSLASLIPGGKGLQGPVMLAKIPISAPTIIRSLKKAANSAEFDQLLGWTGAKIESKSVKQNIAFKGKKYRVDIENPDPGVRAAQIQLQTGSKRTKQTYLYDVHKNKFFTRNKETGFYDIPTSKKFNKDALSNPDIKKSITKAKQLLNEG